MSVLRRVPGAIAIGLEVALVAAVGYLTILTTAAWWGVRRRRSGTAGAPRHRIAVLVPAHDEERLIGATLDSLRAMDYPPELFTVHVVADNCTDGTADVVRARGFDVHERHDAAAPGKGPALQWLMSRLGEQGAAHDAVAFLDADTLADAGFLRAVDRALSDGHVVVQGHYAVRDEGSSPTIAFRAAALAARNFLRPLGRATIGGTAGLYGNGMVFTTEVMRTRRWSDHLTEDSELQLELLEEGIKVAFEPDARVEAEMPATLEAARTQHERWERGRVELARRFVPSLLRRAVLGGPGGRVAALDAAMDQAVPPFSVVVAGSTLWTAAALTRWTWQPSTRSRRRLVVASGVVALQAGYVLSALRMVHAPASVYRSLLQAPRMVAWKLAVWSRVIVRRQPVAWVRTARN